MFGSGRSLKPEPEPSGLTPGSVRCRLNSVEDLLRLARRFDQNLFHQEEDEDEDESSRRDRGPVQPASTGPEPRLHPEPRPRPEPRLHLDQQLEDDLDFLFDGPTQEASGNLSQAVSQNRPGSGLTVTRTGSEPGSGPGFGPGSVQVAFEDDWGDDDLLSDSLVLEMTQNPLGFMVPTLCSTQAPAGSVSVPGQNSLGRVGPSVGTRVEKENLGPRPAFNLERTQDSGKRVQTDLDCSSKDVDQNRFPSGSGVQGSGKPGQTSSFNPAARRSQSSAPDRTIRTADFLDDDLDSLFSSEPVWDDPDDDDLLCEMCDELESRILIQVKTDRSNQSAPLQPTARTCENWFRPDPSVTGRAAGGSLAAGVAAQLNQPIRFLQPKTAVRSGFGSSGSEPSAAPRPSSTPSFTFRKPSNPVTTATGENSNDLIIIIRCLLEGLDL